MFYFLLIIFAVASRLLPHPANVAPIGALALFVGTTALTQKSRGGKLAAYLLPLIALLASDWIIGFYTWQVMVSVYLGFALTTGIGIFARKHYHWSTIVVASLSSSLLFFLLTNAAVWAFTPLYAKTAAGLSQSYVMALPFFRNSLLGDLLYTGVLFGVYEGAIRARNSKHAPVNDSSPIRSNPKGPLRGEKQILMTKI